MWFLVTTPTQMIDLHQDPTGEMAMSSTAKERTHVSLSFHTKERNEIEGGGGGEEIQYLRKRITELEIELSQLKTERDHCSFSISSTVEAN